MMLQIHSKQKIKTLLIFSLFFYLLWYGQFSVAQENLAAQELLSETPELQVNDKWDEQEGDSLFFNSMKWKTLVGTVISGGTAINEQTSEVQELIFQEMPQRSAEFNLSGEPTLFNISEYSIIRGNSGSLSSAPIEPFKGRNTGTMFGGWTSLDGTGKTIRASGIDTSYFGGSLGRDYLLGRYTLWGFTANGGRVELMPGFSQFSAELNSVAGEAHVSIFGTRWYVDLSLGVGRNWNKSRWENGAISEELKFQTTQWNSKVDFGLRMQKGFTKIEPFTGLRLTSLTEPEGASLLPGESVQFIKSKGTNNSTRLLLGSRFHWEYSTYLAIIKPCMNIWWSHEFSDNTIFTTDEMTDFPIAWRYAGNSMERDRLNMGTGLFLGLRDSLDLYFHYKTEIAKHYFGYILFAGFNKKF